MPEDKSPEGAELFHQPVVKPFPEASSKDHCEKAATKGGSDAPRPKDERGLTDGPPDNRPLAGTLTNSGC